MNTRRCELCGTLHTGRGGSVTISVPDGVRDRCSHDHYGLCEACSLKVYDLVEELKTSDGQEPGKHSAMRDLIIRQNAELIRLRTHLRNANNNLYGALKWSDESENSKRMAEAVNMAIEWINRSEPYISEES